MPEVVRVALDEDAFRKLVRGEVVRVRSRGLWVELILSDIGFGRMEKALVDALADQRKK